MKKSYIQRLLEQDVDTVNHFMHVNRAIFILVSCTATVTLLILALLN